MKKILFQIILITVISICSVPYLTIGQKLPTIQEVKPKGVSISTSDGPQQTRTINFTAVQPVIGQYATDFWGYYELAK